MRSLNWRRWRFPIVSVGIAVVLMVAAFLFGTVGSPADDVSSELRKSFIQFFLVTALGALVGVVVYEYRSRREVSEQERRYATDSVVSVLRQLDAIYRDVKTVRRRLRISQARGELSQAYNEAALKLDEHQQDLEQLARDLDVLNRQAQSTAPARARSLAQARGAIKRMEEYLGALWSEREDVAALSQDEFEALEKFNAFLARVATGKSDFQHFNGGYREARRELIGVLADTAPETAARA